MTTPTTAGGAVLPAWREKAFEDFAVDFGATFEIRSCGTTYADAQTHAMWCCWSDTAQAEIGALRAENERLKSEMQERALQALCDDGQWMEETGRLHAELAALKAALNPPAHTPPTGVFVQAAQDDQARDAGRLDYLQSWAQQRKLLHHKWDTFMFDFTKFATVREAIDAAIAATKETP